MLTCNLHVLNPVKAQLGPSLCVPWLCLQHSAGTGQRQGVDKLRGNIPPTAHKARFVHGSTPFFTGPRSHLCHVYRSESTGWERQRLKQVLGAGGSTSNASAAHTEGSKFRSLEPTKAERSSPHLSPQYSVVRREAKRGESPGVQGPASLEYAAAEKILPQTRWKVKTDPQGANDFPYHHGTCPPLPAHTLTQSRGEKGEGGKEEEPS